MTRFLLVCAGGALGSGLRYLVGTTIATRFDSWFPAATFLVNVSGCFLLGLLWSLAPRYGVAESEWFIPITVGVLGGFTTYSSFNQQMLVLHRTGNTGGASIYALATFLFCLGAGWLGSLLGHVAGRAQS